MVLETEKKTITLQLKNRLVALLEERLQCKDLRTFLFQEANNAKIKTLALCLLTLTEKEFKNINEVYDFLDDYQQEQEKTIFQLYQDLILELNNRYFFKEKLSEEELAELSQNPMMGFDMGEIMKAATEAVATDMAGQALAASGK